MQPRNLVVVLTLAGAPSCTSATTSSEKSTPPPAVEAPPVEAPTTPQRFVQRNAEIDGFVEAQLPAGWRLPHGSIGVTPLHNGLGLALQREGLFLGDELLAPAADGQLVSSSVDQHVILPLRDRLEVLTPALEQEAVNRGEVWDGHANLFMDPDTRFSDLVDTMYTLGRAGFMSYQLAVAGSEQFVTSGVAVSPPKYYVTPSGKSVRTQVTNLLVFVSNTSVTVARQGAAEIEIVENLERNEETLAKLADLVEQEIRLLTQNGWQGPRTAIFSADPSVPIGSLIEAMMATSGPNCDYRDEWGLDGGDPRDCHFPHRLIEAGKN